jgi:hypothetical protein
MRTQSVVQCRKARLMPWRAMRRGVRRLDTVMPGWAEYVNPSTLDMGHDERCVLAQIDYDEDAGMGTYAGGLYRVGLGHGWDHGFDINARRNWSTTDAAYAKLTAAWRAYLAGRLVIKELGTAQ